MTIWSSEIKELESLFTSIKGRFPDLEKDLEHLIKTDDENVALLYSRRCLEIIITDLCECELKRPRKTEPLKGIIDKLHKEDKVPAHIVTSMESLNSLSTYGTHPKEFDPEQVKPVLNNLKTILKWYLKYKSEKFEAEESYRVQGARYKEHEEGYKEHEEGYKEHEEGYKVQGAGYKLTGAGNREQGVESRDQKPSEAKETLIKSKRHMIFLISGISLVIVIVVVALFELNVIGKKETREIEKSIAVLPFKLLSDEPDKQYLADGMMDAILLHLSKIEDLRVMSRTSVEQYRDPTKTIPEIGRELGVEYLLEGSFQKFGDNVKLIVQLIRASKESHIWANEYDRNWKDIFAVQSEVAQSIARELDAAITPEEKQIIEKIPTTNLTAYDYYQKGKEEFVNFYVSNWSQDYDKQEGPSKAEKFYLKALNYDSAFAPAYSGLAIVYIYKNRQSPEAYFAENFLDSSMIMANRSLSFDDKLAEAYYVRGLYYKENGKLQFAKDEYEKALKYNPNYWEAYAELGNYIYNNLDLVKSIEYLQRAVDLNHGKEYPALLSWLASAYSLAGFYDKVQYSWAELFGMYYDTLYELYAIASTESNFFMNFDKSLEYCKIGYKLDSNNVDILLEMSTDYMHLGQYSESLKYCKKYIERVKNLGHLRLNSTHRIAYVYWQTGYKKEAEYYFIEQKRNCEEAIEQGRSYAIDGSAYYDLAGIYAFQGDREKALENLRIWAKRPVFTLWWINFIKNDQLFENLHNDAEFQQIVREAEAKYQAEHERVGRWLEEQGR